MAEWTIQSALAWTEQYLAEKGDENPRISAQWLLSEATHLSRTQLFVHFDQPLSADERACLRDFVARRATGEPLQYITGEVTFRYIPVKVRPGVLIPRPETEVLVSEVLARLPQPSPRQVKWSAESFEEESMAVQAVLEALALQGDSDEVDPAHEVILIADLCTGSGCIACSLAHEHSDVRVIATDLSPEAVALAKENVAALQLEDRVAVLQCDVAAGIGKKRNGTFSAVVSNPPYIPTAVLDEIPGEVTNYEPDLALDGGVDGLDIFRRILSWSLDALKPTGLLACELYEGHMEDALQAARSVGFTDVCAVNDLTGRPRVLLARKQGGSKPC